jgi:alpha-glucosidase
LEYIILDEGWYKLGDLMAVVSEVDMDELASYAKEKGVGLVMWVVWKTLDNQLEEVLDQFEKWDVKGLKVDFMQRDDQWMVNYYERISKAAAEKKDVCRLSRFLQTRRSASKISQRVDPGGCLRPGAQQMDGSATPQHNVTIPFIRMVAGPLDYTPGAMLNASEEHFSANFNRPMSLGNPMSSAGHVCDL